MDGYNEKLREIAEKDILIANLQKQLGKRPQVERRPLAQIVASRAHPPSTKPIVEIPGIPRTPKYYTPKELKEEMNKVKVAQIRVAMNFENKLKGKITYLIERADWPRFYSNIKKFSDILKRLRDNEPIVRTILDRWIRRE